MAQGTREVDSRPQTDFKTRISGRHWLDYVFTALVYAATAVGLIVLAVLLVSVMREGVPRIDWQFITGYPSQVLPETAVLPLPATNQTGSARRGRSSTTRGTHCSWR